MLLKWKIILKRKHYQIPCRPSFPTFKRDSESEGDESEIVTNSDQSPSIEEWLRYAGRLNFDVKNAKAFVLSEEMW